MVEEPAAAGGQVAVQGVVGPVDLGEHEAEHLALGVGEHRGGYERPLAGVLPERRGGRGDRLAGLLHGEQDEPDEREPGEAAQQRLAAAVVLVGRALDVREHEHEQERDDDRPGVDDDGRGHQERGGQQQEQPARAEDHEREGDRPAGRVPLDDERGAEPDGAGREQDEQELADPVGGGVAEAGVGPDAGDRGGGDEGGRPAHHRPGPRLGQQQDEPVQ